MGLMVAMGTDKFECRALSRSTWAVLTNLGSAHWISSDMALFRFVLDTSGYFGPVLPTRPGGVTKRALVENCGLGPIVQTKRMCDGRA